ncbi:MAG: beta-galactosidase [Bacteroidota bacterium]
MIKFFKNLLLLAIFFLSVAINSGKTQTLPAYIGDAKTYYGVAYYPEAWDFKTLAKDIELMKEVNINVVRMGEFSWNLMEPREGQYEFDWLHKVIDQLYKNDIHVILGTPTASPPLWMAKKYPEIFKVDENGNRKGHGARKNTSFSSETYRSFSRKICDQLGKEFGNKPGVIAWQTDNEFSASSDFSEETRRRWVKWLQQRYQNIENLNDIWATNLWSMEYASFEDIPMAKPNIWHHPSLRIDWTQFCSDQVVAFQQIQLDALRKYTKTPITHDAMPGQSLNYPDLFENLDFMTTNFYHNFSVYSRVQTNFDRLRGYSKGLHWVFETAPNYSGGGPKGKNWFIHQPKGAVRAITWSNYAMGGQGTIFWLWRQHPAGQEMVHGSFISAWGKKAANWNQLKQIGQELKDQSEFILNTPVDKADIAIIYSHKADMGFRVEQYTSNDIRYYTDWAQRFYQPMSDAFLHRDVIHEGIDLSNYKMVVAPMLPSLNPEYIDQVERWVKNGGTLLLGPMSGYRTEYYTAPTEHALGKIGNWIGLEVESRIPIDGFNSKEDQPLLVQFKDSDVAESKGGLWSEALSSKQGKVLATYKNGMHDGQAAIIETQVGKGKVVFFGTDPGKKAMQHFYLKYAAEQNIQPIAKGDDKVVVVPRSNGKDNYQFVINLANETKQIELATPIKQDLLSGKKEVKKKLMLQPFEVIIGKTKQDSISGQSDDRR